MDQHQPGQESVTAPRRVTVVVAPRTVARWCLAGAAFFFVADLVALVATMNGAEAYALFPRLFDTDIEANLPSWYSSMLLAATALAALLKARQERAAQGAWWRYWAALSALFLALSIDEASAIHEDTVHPLKGLFEMLGVSEDTARIAAVLVIVVVLLILAVPLTRWLRAQPQWARRAYFGAVMLFVGVALGMETVARLLEQSRGTLEPEQGLLAGIEELFEMVASTTLLVTTLSLLEGEAA